ncbi:MAG: hypothetical protein ACREJD_05445 [Phycisphaerales bacterium]
MRWTLYCGSVATACLCGGAIASITDNFESYALGSFPSAKWVDARTLVPGATSPDPSGTVISTAGPTGTTRAFQTTRAVGTSQGIVTGIAPSTVVSISANVRYDRFDNSNNKNGGGWPMALGFFQWTSGNDPNFSPQVTLYADSTFKNWSLYIQTSANPADFQFIRLTSALTATSTWYFMSLEIDTATGTVSSKVRLANSVNFIVNDTRTISGWNPAFAQYNIAGALDGEYGTNATTGGQATVDNITVIPVPGVLGFAGALMLATRRRR